MIAKLRCFVGHTWSNQSVKPLIAFGVRNRQSIGSYIVALRGRWQQKQPKSPMCEIRKKMMANTKGAVELLRRPTDTALRFRPAMILAGNT